MHVVYYGKMRLSKIKISNNAVDNYLKERLKNILKWKLVTEYY